MLKNIFAHASIFREVFTFRGMALGFMSALILSLFSGIMAFLIIPVIILYLVVLDKTEIILMLIVFSFLAVTRNISSELRDVLQYMNILLLFLLLVKKHLKKELTLPDMPKELYVFLGVYISALLIASVFAGQVFTGLDHIIRQVIFLGMIYAIFLLIENRQAAYYPAYGIIAAALFQGVITIYSLYQVNFDLTQFGADYFLSLSTDLTLNKNTIGIYLLYGLILSAVLFRFRESFIYKSLITGIIFILLIGMILINSRAVLLALAVSFLFLLYKLKVKYFYYSLTGLLILVAMVFLPPFNEFFELYFRVEELFGQRDIITQSSWSLIQNEWLMGTGPGGTKALIYKYIPFMLGSPEEMWIRHHFYQIEYGHAHNYFLFMLSDLGVLGLAASLILCYAYIKIGLTVMAAYKQIEPNLYFFSAALLSLGIGMFVRGFFEWGGILGYGMINTDLPFWTGFAILIYLHTLQIHSTKSA